MLPLFWLLYSGERVMGLDIQIIFMMNFVVSSVCIKRVDYSSR